MTLTTRLTAFSLAALAVLLLGFSSALYLLARAYLYRQAEDRLVAALNTLVASAEVERDGIEWDPQERHLSVRPEGLDGPVQWVVTDGDRRRVDSSPSRPDDLLVAGYSTGDTADQPGEFLWQGSPWLVSQRRLEVGQPASGPRRKSLGPGHYGCGASGAGAGDPRSTSPPPWAAFPWECGCWPPWSAGPFAGGPCFQ